MARDGGELVIERVMFACPLLPLLVSKVGTCECLGFCAIGGFGFAGVFCRAEECLMRVALLVGCSTVGLGHDFREPERESFHEYLIFFDETFCDHHLITCTLPGSNPKN